MNRCLQEVDVPEWMIKWKATVIQKHPPQRNRPKQQQIHNVPTHDMESTNCENKEIDLRLANKSQIVLQGTERMPLMIQKHRRATLHWSAHPQREQDETEKSSYSLDWLQKGTRYGLAKLDYKLPQNV